MTWIGDVNLILERLLRSEAVRRIADVHDIWAIRNHKKIDFTILFRDVKGYSLDDVSFSMDQCGLVIAEDTIVAVAKAFEIGFNSSNNLAH